MARRLPPFSIAGANVLRGSKFVSEPIGIARGHFVQPGERQLDLSGYLILPGAIDLNGQTTLTRSGLLAHDARAAAEGMTTSWISVEVTTDGPQSAARNLAVLSSLATLTDLRPRLDIPLEIAEPRDHLSGLIEDFAVGCASISTATLSDRSGTTELNAEFRKICQLAEVLDQLGVWWTARGANEVDRWERYRMLGARACEAPRSRAVAAAAAAMDCPVVLCQGPDAERERWVSILREGFGAAVATAGSTSALTDVPWQLSDLGVMGFAEAWQLVSTAPARLLGMRDRGRLAPGLRADLVAVNPRTRRVELTIAGGALVYAAGVAAARVSDLALQDAIAAE